MDFVRTKFVVFFLLLYFLFVRYVSMIRAYFNSLFSKKRVVVAAAASAVCYCRRLINVYEFFECVI